MTKNVEAIIELAKEYQVGSIVVPKMENIREIIQTEVQVRAEAKIPGCIEKQKEYVKKYRINLKDANLSRRQIISPHDSNLSSTTFN